MSVLASAQESYGQSDNAVDFQHLLLTHAHKILQMGYCRLNTSTLSKAPEEDITGDLAKAMNEALASPDAPSWRTYYAVHEEPRVWNAKRKGKRRLRLDIQVEYTGETRPRFSFEAKRLRGNNPQGISKSVCAYFGDEGLGCFVLGLYAHESDEAGMIAYIQTHDLEHWIEKIEAGLKRRTEPCEWNVDKGWGGVQIAGGPETIFATSHARSKVKREIRIYHTMLLFLPSKASNSNAAASKQ
jgi:hypothetical protein